MKKFLIIFVLLSLCVTSFVSAQETTKTYCLSAFDYQGSVDEMKAELLIAAKREAVREFFGEFISSFTKVEDLSITEDIIQATSLGFIRIKGDPEYYNGKNLGEVCVKINAYTTEEDFAQFQPQTLTQKSCIMEGDVKTIKQDTEKKAIFEALLNYDRRLEAYSPEQVLPLLREVTFSDEGFVPETEVYCAKVTGIMYPIEVMGTLVLKQEEEIAKEEGEGIEEEETATPGRTEFSFDFTKYQLGDIPVELLGQNLVIGQTEKGEKYIRGQSAAPVGEIAIKALRLSDTFEFILKADWAATHPKYREPGWNSPFSQSILILAGNEEEIKVEFVNSGDVILGDASRHWGRTAWHKEVNTIKVVVKDNQAKLFINDQLFGSMLVKPDITYNTVIVKGIIDHDAIFGLSVRNL